MSLSVQVIDEAYGLPVPGLGIRLDRAADGSWVAAVRGQTGERGQISQWSEAIAEPGNYRLEFGTDSYFAGLGITPVYANVSVKFRVPDPGHELWIQLLLTPSAYHICWQR